ncbi:uncharacterized protein LOC100678157 [Nasonia vitripennis]|uniref:DUF4806 domain-containing protein n=1 Tax=Nasonia vitripennis TaxID=7425 RepID=A0A7M7ITH9_NASVI|nr:uncharacterized protein LOC100678157 [Nasonia vitripennis]XP_031784584.1 uncharacterized protein LOC100678157 [Nasonia vitripennis]XP_031784585.1 uncharacterized protein LOC100678157 [Nasonia vitripennis]
MLKNSIDKLIRSNNNREKNVLIDVANVNNINNDCPNTRSAVEIHNNDNCVVDILGSKQNDQLVIYNNDVIDNVNEPFENVEDLDDFDERLGDPREADMADQFEKLLASKGGNTLSKIVSKAMSAFITDVLCKKITWTGVKDTLKAEIMNFPSIVIKVVRKQFACKDSETEEQIKDWLRRPSDRIAQAAKTQRNKMMRQERRLQRRGNRQNEN